MIDGVKVGITIANAAMNNKIVHCSPENQAIGFLFLQNPTFFICFNILLEIYI